MKHFIAICGIIIALSLLAPIHHSLAKSVLFLQGDTMTVLGKKLTLDTFIQGSAFWKGEDGKLYEIEAAKHKSGNPADYVITEIVLTKNKKSIAQRKASFLIGPDLPPPKKTETKIQQVALLQMIDNGKLMDRNSMQPSGIIVGLSYYMKGDSAIFAKEQFTLDPFQGTEGIWKSKDGVYYKITVQSKKSGATYVPVKV